MAFRGDRRGEYGGFTYNLVFEGLPTYEAAETALERVLIKGPHPFEAELHQLIKKHAWQATEEELLFFGEVLHNAVDDEVNVISEKRFPHDDKED
jgi:hypothetical protein